MAKLLAIRNRFDLKRKQIQAKYRRRVEQHQEHEDILYFNQNSTENEDIEEIVKNEEGSRSVHTGSETLFDDSD